MVGVCASIIHRNLSAGERSVCERAGEAGGSSIQAQPAHHIITCAVQICCTLVRMVTVIGPTTAFPSGTARNRTHGSDLSFILRVRAEATRRNLSAGERVVIYAITESSGSSVWAKTATIICVVGDGARSHRVVRRGGGGGGGGTMSCESFVRFVMWSCEQNGKLSTRRWVGAAAAYCLSASDTSVNSSTSMKHQQSNH
jgi:hypothetical protein